jgi:Ni,Fe-hydrogenase III large subunit
MIEINALFCRRIQVWITYGTVSSSEQIFAICAFTTTTGFVGYVEIALNCEDPVKVKLGYSYPFR